MSSDRLSLHRPWFRFGAHPAPQHVERHKPAAAGDSALPLAARQFYSLPV